MDTGTAKASTLRRGRVTISDVARSLNMAKGTVSRALNGYSDIAETTRARVKSEADRMGYVPLALAQAIRTGRAKSIGLVFQEDEDGGAAPFLAEFLAGVSTATSQNGWTLTVATAKSLDGVLETQSRLIGERKADGFILPRSRVSDERIQQLSEAGIPFVLFGRPPEGVECDWFDVAGDMAMRDAVIRLAHLGHKRIGFVKGSADYIYSGLRSKGYQLGLEDAGLPFDPNLVGSDAVTFEQGEESGRALLALNQPPTAIVCAVDHAALGVYEAAKSANLDIGKDLSVISYDGIPEGAFANPALTTYSVDRRNAGERLASILINRIRHESAEVQRELVPAQLIARASDGPPACSSDELAKRWRAQTQHDQSQREETK